MARFVAPRFGIGEWYGRSFVRLTPEQRSYYAGVALTQSKANAPTCPFLSTSQKAVQCTKKGGICSLRLYDADEELGCGVPTASEAGKLRVICPHRFKQNGTIYSEVGKVVLGTETPSIAYEVRFLRRTGSSALISPDEIVEDVAEGKSEDVGNIDVVLVDTESPFLRWCALEIQAVYFSGEKMSLLFQHIKDFKQAGLPFPDKVRRPDYRSSGPKRLMPQLQIKVPTLRRPNWTLNREYL